MSVWISPAAILRDGPARNRPGAALVLADGEERHVAEQVVAGANDAIEAGLREAESARNAAASAGSSSAISSSIFAQSGDRAPSIARDENAVRPDSAGAPLDRSRRVGDVGLVEVDHDEQRLGREKLEAAQPLQIVALEPSARSGVPVLERLLAAHASGRVPSRARRTCVFFRSFSSRSSRRSATPRSARISSSSIACASRAGSTEPDAMRDRAIAKRAHDVHERVGVLVGRRRRRAPARRRRPAPAMSANSTVAGHPFLRVVHRGQPIEPLVGHLREMPMAARSCRGRAAVSRRSSSAGTAWSCRWKESRSVPREAWTEHAVERQNDTS